ncbi:MAG: CocE/NonD family hydrolase [Bacteroidaceae bacterium]|nr:CocE/NonD family hydrolase [Bacteroidaceae bacterium]
MKTFFLFVFTLLFPFCADAQDATGEIDSEWVRQHYSKREVMIPMRDGVRLFTAVYEPTDKSVPHPVLIYRSCYGCAPYGEDEYEDFSRPTWAMYAKDQYILVFQDVRGKNKSEGTFEDLRPFIVDKRKKTQIDEASDTYDTVDWLVKNTHSNERVGVFGISYPGFYAMMAGLSSHPAVKAVSPQAPVTDWYRGDDTHHNGALFVLDMFPFEFWFEHVNKPSFWNTYQIDPNQVNPTDVVHTDVYNDYLKLGTVRNMTRLLGDSCKFWNDMLAHPDLDPWWEERNVAYYCQDVKPAVMIVGGLFDAEDCFGAFTTYNAIRNQSPQTELYLVEGPWSHGVWSRGATGYLGDIWFGGETDMFYYLDNFEYPFFSYYLNNKGEKPKPGAMVFQTGENKWRHFPEGWTFNRTTEPFYLQHDGGIGQAEPTDQTTAYVSDPARPVPFYGKPLTSRPSDYMTADQRFAATRTDVAVFQTDVLSEPLVLDGSVEADLNVAISTTDCDFIVKIIDVFPDDFEYSEKVRQYMNGQQSSRFRPLMAGYQMLVRWEVMRGKYRNCMELDSTAFNTTDPKAMKNYRFHPKSPEPFTPGQPTNVRFKLPDIAHTFLPGHRLMVQVQSSCFPLIDRNPQTFCNIYECDEEAFQPCTVQLLHSEKHPSRIWLPVVN